MDTQSSTQSDFAFRMPLSMNENVPVKSFGENNAFKAEGLTMRSRNYFKPNFEKGPYRNKMFKQHSPKKMNLNPMSPYRRLHLQKQMAKMEQAKIKEMQDIKQYPEPEALAHELNLPFYEDMFLDMLDVPFKNLISQDEDEGFISDPEYIPLPKDIPDLPSPESNDDDDDDLIPTLEEDLSFIHFEDGDDTIPIDDN